MNIKSISSAILVLCSIALSASITGCTSKEEKDAAAKANSDIARIRELKDKEDAVNVNRAAADKEYTRKQKEALQAPLRTIN